MVYTRQELPCPLRPFFSMEKAWIFTLGSIEATTEKKDSYNEQPALTKLEETPEKKILQVSVESK